MTGQKVVCIDDKFDTTVANLYVALPEEGKTYVIRGSAPGVPLDNLNDQGGAIAVYLEGLHNPCSKAPPHREFGFKEERFRPLEELTTEEILNQSQEIAA